LTTSAIYNKRLIKSLKGKHKRVASYKGFKRELKERLKKVKEGKEVVFCL